MTFDDMVLAALARTMDWDAEFPSSRLPMYRRVGVRQQQLFSRAAKINPDYFGVCAIGTLDPGPPVGINLRLLEDDPNVDATAGAHLIRVEDEGTSSLTSGDEIHIVTIDDPTAELAPRVTIRDYAIEEVGTDLTGVTSIKFFYPRYPDLPATGEDGTTTIELPEWCEELLVIDLTRDLVRKTLTMESDVKVAVAAQLKEEEAEHLVTFDEDVRGFAIGQHHRFSDPRHTTTR